MHNFSYARPADIGAALRLVSHPGAQFIAGGTNLLDLMKGGIAKCAACSKCSAIPC